MGVKARNIIYVFLASNNNVRYKSRKDNILLIKVFLSYVTSEEEKCECRYR